MRFQVLAVILASSFSFASAQSVNVAERSSRALDVVIKQSGWRNLPSTNIRHEKLVEPSTRADLVFKTLLRRAGLSQSGFRLKFGDIGNVVCDTQRKFIIADPSWLALIEKQSRDPQMVFTALFAHELSHYILDVYRDVVHEEVFGSKPFVVINQTVPEADDEHAQVEPLAAEIVRRAGYSHDQTREMFAQYLKLLKLIRNELNKAFPGGTPSSDIETRELVIEAYFAGRSK